MRLTQSFLTCFGLCLIAASIALTPSVAYADPFIDCQDSNCLDCTSANDKFDVCPYTPAEPCSCECNGKSKPWKCYE